MCTSYSVVMATTFVSTTYNYSDYLVSDFCVLNWPMRNFASIKPGTMSNNMKKESLELSSWSGTKLWEQGPGIGIAAFKKEYVRLYSDINIRTGISNDMCSNTCILMMLQLKTEQQSEPTDLLPCFN